MHAVEGDAQFVTLGIDNEVFAVPVEAVREILDVKPVVRLAGAPPYLAGLIDVRGSAVPVIDLRTKLGLPRVEPTENTRLLVLEVSVGGRDLVLALVTDRVFEVAGFPRVQIEPPPDIGLSWHSDYISGVCSRDESFVILLNLGRLFSSEEAAFLGSQAVAGRRVDADAVPADGDVAAIEA